jgi:hypothetical protein
MIGERTMVTSLRPKVWIMPTVVYPDSPSIPRREITNHQESIGFLLRKICRPVEARPKFKEELFKRLEALDCGKGKA